jgi:hypothetical protein
MMLPCVLALLPVAVWMCCSGEPPHLPADRAGQQPWDPQRFPAVHTLTAEECPLPVWLDSAPPYAEPPWEEPEDGNLIDVEAFAPDDAVWDDFYAMPFVLPPDPEKEWALEHWARRLCPVADVIRVRPDPDTGVTTTCLIPVLSWRLLPRAFGRQARVNVEVMNGV